jgi:hypothetical protein
VVFNHLKTTTIQQTIFITVSKTSAKKENRLCIFLLHPNPTEKNAPNNKTLIDQKAQCIFYHVMLIQSPSHTKQTNQTKSFPKQKQKTVVGFSSQIFLSPPGATKITFTRSTKINFTL